MLSTKEKMDKYINIYGYYNNCDHYKQINYMYLGDQEYFLTAPKKRKKAKKLKSIIIDFAVVLGAVAMVAVLPALGCGLLSLLGL